MIAGSVAIVIVILTIYKQGRLSSLVFMTLCIALQLYVIRQRYAPSLAQNFVAGVDKLADITAQHLTSSFVTATGRLTAVITVQANNLKFIYQPFASCPCCHSQQIVHLVSVLDNHPNFYQDYGIDRPDVIPASFYDVKTHTYFQDDKTARELLLCLNCHSHLGWERISNLPVGVSKGVRLASMLVVLAVVVMMALSVLMLLMYVLTPLTHSPSAWDMLTVTKIGLAVVLLTGGGVGAFWLIINLMQWYRSMEKTPYNLKTITVLRDRT